MPKILKYRQRVSKNIKIIFIMKKMFLVLAIIAVFLVGSGFRNSVNQNLNLSIHNPKSENSCKVVVTYKGGSAASSIKVSTDVCGGISCSGGRNFYTNSKGEVTVYWVDGCKLCYIYVDGTSYESTYENGKTYYFIIN